jgi:hypothetical protein
MNRSTCSFSLSIFAALLSLAFVACGPGDSMPGSGGTDGGRSGSGSGGSTDKLGDNASVPGTCQTCLASSTSNECAAKGRICSGDPGCEKLNTCINKCANINAACIQNCSDGASQDAIDEWNNWAGCDCGTCASQCNATFCSIGYGNGSGSGSGSGTCLADNAPCSTTQACCTFCASDNNCGCIPSNNQGCAADEDCCSHDCEGGYCY